MKAIDSGNTVTGLVPLHVRSEIAKLKKVYFFLDEVATVYTEWEKLVTAYASVGKGAHVISRELREYLEREAYQKYLKEMNDLRFQMLQFPGGRLPRGPGAPGPGPVPVGR